MRDVGTVLLLGSGGLSIGQAGEFDQGHFPAGDFDRFAFEPGFEFGTL